MASASSGQRWSPRPLGPGWAWRLAHAPFHRRTAERMDACCDKCVGAARACQGGRAERSRPRLLGCGSRHRRCRRVLHRGGTPGRTRAGALGGARRAGGPRHGPVQLLWLAGARARSVPSVRCTLRIAQTRVDKTARSAGIVICYGLFGLGYILPATFLPVMARQVVDDPAVFGLAWPMFGIAAALSTIGSPHCSIVSIDCACGRAAT